MQSLAPSIARATEAQVQRLVQFMAASRRLVVLSGAGISTGTPRVRCLCVERCSPRATGVQRVVFQTIGVQVDRPIDHCKTRSLLGRTWSGAGIGVGHPCCIRCHPCLMPLGRARSMVGFPKMSAVRPNATHSALAALERDGYVAHIVTQNVDSTCQRGGQ